MAFKTPRWTLANILPLLFVVKIILFLYVLFGYLHLLPLLKDPETRHRGTLQTAISQSITFILLVCFARAIIADPGSVPDTPDWQLGTGEASTSELKQTGERRFCKWCNNYKPDRCHHCRVCRSCVLRMDHHCPWIANCVGFHNHKFFLLLVFYSMVNVVYILVTMRETAAKAIHEEMLPWPRFGVVYCMTLAAMMAALLVPFFLLHLSFMFKAQTTIEFCEKRSKKSGNPISYDMGIWHNMKNTFGPNVLLWLVPVSLPQGDGLRFESSRKEPLLTDSTPPADGVKALADSSGATAANCART